MPAKGGKQGKCTSTRRVTPKGGGIVYTRNISLLTGEERKCVLFKIQVDHSQYLTGFLMTLPDLVCIGDIGLSFGSC